MCRFLVYRGPEIFLSDLLTRSEQSLIRQSYQAREREEPLNGDGFGVGWYARSVDPTPAVFTAITPAWSNRNLKRLADKLRSDCVFAHVRAATAGGSVSETNCHPFQYREFLWMHNGWIPDFHRVKRRIRERLSDEHYNLIQGTTDSEHAFALFLDNLERDEAEYGVEKLRRAMQRTVRDLVELCRNAGIERPAYFNFAVTDGVHVIVTRYVSDLDVMPETLYVAMGQRFEYRDGRYEMISDGDGTSAVIVASEPLTDDRDDWSVVEPNQLVAVSPGLEVSFFDVRDVA